MRFKNQSLLFICCLFISFFAIAQDRSFPIVTSTTKASIVYDRNGHQLDSIAANLLADDIERVTSYRPKVFTDLSKANGNVIIIGSIQSSLVQRFVSRNTKINIELKNKWECFGLTVIKRPIKNISKALIIAGSDARGTAYGVFTISEKLGVSPWYWWADVPVSEQKELIIRQSQFVSSTPSVKYRGIFINDEDWGLRPWAANTFEPEVKNIGPKTYAKVFELLLRLKANLLWPAMHPGTTPFYNVPGNAETASAYAIVVGSSHAEPMLRNNVGEWDEKTMGHFNYINNKQKVYTYWEDRVKQSKGNDVVYTLGMRGVHDSGMEGVKGPKEAVPLLEQIINDQRGLITNHINKNAEAVPQVFTAYKEVLDIYDQGLKLPDDVTIVWPDDNYGYIQRLNTEAEKKRSGGSGVYYHASYWGRPHDYLWLGTTHPSLIRQEMMKAYETGADRLWVLNVGDIKSIEYSMHLFLDMAYDVAPFKETKSADQHLFQWSQRIFGKKEGPLVHDILWGYYCLAFERRPEFMGWSQTEPTTKTNYTSFNHFYFGDEVQNRLLGLHQLEYKVRSLRDTIKGPAADAFYQLVYYPVICAGWMNRKFLFRDRAFVYAKQNRIIANHYAELSRAAYDSIINETNWFNEKLNNGKWKGMMSMKPRDLPVFQPPDISSLTLEKGIGWNAVPVGYDTVAFFQNANKKLPRYTRGIPGGYFIDIFLTDSHSVSLKAKPSADWISLQSREFELVPRQDKSSERIRVAIDWEKLPGSELVSGSIEFTAGGPSISIDIEVFQPANYEGYMESNGYVSIDAGNGCTFKDKNGSKWAPVSDFIFPTAYVLQSDVSLSRPPDTTNLRNSAASVSYKFFSFSNDTPKVSVYTLPTHPLNRNFSMRYGMSLDDGPIQIVDFRTFGRSEEWKQNVLRNYAVTTAKFAPLAKGLHTITIYAIDPYVVMERILINFSNRQVAYGTVNQTYKLR